MFSHEEDDDVLSTRFESVPQFAPDVQEAIDALFPSDDRLDRPDFDVVTYINTLFPTEQSLSNIDDVIAGFQGKIRKLDTEIRDVVRGQSNVAEEGRQSLEEAQIAIQQLFEKIIDIKHKAEKSEDMVKEITSDIKQLDIAKRNLTCSITTLNHLHMLIGDVESLGSLIEQRRYDDIANYLERTQSILDHFESYMDIPQISALADDVKKLEIRLGRQIQDDFRDEFESGPGAAAKHSAVNLRVLADACKVVDNLEPKVKRQLIDWFVRIQLSEYNLLFDKSQDSQIQAYMPDLKAAWLDKVDKRYAWAKKALVEFEQRYGQLFPVDWEMSERIAVHFCRVTRDHLTGAMQQRRMELDVKVLLFAIQKTGAWEVLLDKRFTGVTIDDAKPPELETTAAPPTLSTSPKSPPQSPIAPAKPPPSPFHGIISSCFETHLNIYIESQDRNLADLIGRFVDEMKAPPPSHLAATGPASRSGLVVDESNILPSAADLFVFYKKCMVQCAQLSAGQPMVQLCAVFKKYLNEYGQKVLINFLPRPTAGTTSTSQLIGTALTGASSNPQAAGIALWASLKEGVASLDANAAPARLSERELLTVCALLCTAEYCMDTTQQLGEKLREKVAVPELRAQIDLAPEQDAFHNVISQCISVIVHDLEAACDPSLHAMTKLSWQAVSAVGDQSQYSFAIEQHLQRTIPIVRDGLASSRKYFTQLCTKFARSFIPKLISALYRCKPISGLGAEQLLLDTQHIRAALARLPSLGSAAAALERKPATSYTKVVVAGMSRAEMILKVVMTPHIPARPFVENYVRLLPDSDANEFQKVLEMKIGLRRAEQLPLVELYHRLAQPQQQQQRLDSSGGAGAAVTPGSAPGGGVASTGVPGTLPAPIAAPGASAVAASLPSPDHDVGHIRKLERLIKRKM